MCRDFAHVHAVICCTAEIRHVGTPHRCLMMPVKPGKSLVHARMPTSASVTGMAG